MKKSLSTVACALVLVLTLAQCSSDQSAEQNTSTPGAIEKAPTGQEAFYTPPSPLPETEPGKLIWSQALSDAPDNVNAWRVLYVTTGVQGTPVATSALIYSPRDNKKHNLVAWAHGTTGIADDCAPSRTKNADNDIPYFDDYIKEGYSVVAPDYEGLGTPGVHPFLVGASEGRSVLDSIRMAQDFVPINAKEGAVIVGHSQGGHAALFAGELQSTYAPEVELKGVVAVAPAGNLGEVFTQASLSPIKYGFVVLGSYGFKAANPDLDLSQIYSSTVLAKEQVINEQCLGGVIQAYNEDVSQGFVKDPSTVDPWPALFAQNSPGEIKIDAPVFLLHGLDDDTVPSNVSKDIFDKECALGARLDRKVFEGASHSGVLDLGKDDALGFVADRFSGKKFVGSC